MTASAIISVGCAIETSAETVTHNFYVKMGIPNKDKEESILPQLWPPQPLIPLLSHCRHLGCTWNLAPLLWAPGTLSSVVLSPPPMVPRVDAPVKKPSGSGFKSCLRLSWWCLWHVSGPQHPCLIRGLRGDALRVCSWGAATFQTNLS